jgi:hypothetical protein
MPSPFVFKLPHLRKKGPVCRVILRPSDPTIKELALEKKNVPEIGIWALIDTGASSTAVSHKIIKRLKLQPRSMVRVHTSNKRSEVRTEYDVSLEFETGAYLSLLRVIDAHLPHQNIDCLIGRDVLQFGVFEYNGVKKEITLTF